MPNRPKLQHLGSGGEKLDGAPQAGGADLRVTSSGSLRRNGQRLEVPEHFGWKLAQLSNSHAFWMCSKFREKPQLGGARLEVGANKAVSEGSRALTHRDAHRVGRLC